MRKTIISAALAMSCLTSVAPAMASDKEKTYEHAAGIGMGSGMGIQGNAKSVSVFGARLGGLCSSSAASRLISPHLYLV